MPVVMLQIWKWLVVAVDECPESARDRHHHLVHMHAFMKNAFGLPAYK